jgi:hypothetical protein
VTAPLALPAPDAPAEEWGRLAVAIPGFRSVQGMLWRGEDGVPMGKEWSPWISPDDPATAGCLLALLGGPVEVKVYHGVTIRRYPRIGCLLSEGITGRGSNLGRACIAAAATLGRWPGGAS